MVPLIVGLVVGVDEMLEVEHNVVVALPVLETDMVGLTEAEVHPETVLVEQMLGVFVTVKVPVWHRLSEEVVVTDVVKDGVRVPDPQALVVILVVGEFEPETVDVTDGQTLKVTLEVKECEPDTVVVTDELKDVVRVPDPQALEVTLGDED